MAAAVSAATLFNDLAHRLGLEWIAGAEGATTIISDVERESEATLARAESDLVGHLNLIHFNRIQVLGPSEFRYLQSLGKNSHDDALHQLFALAPAAVVITTRLQAPDALCAELAAAAGRIALWQTIQPADVVVDRMDYYLRARLARTVIVHGVFMEVMGIGVLLTGDSGVGKSELALDLLNRGHRLIADDATQFSRLPADVLDGTCPTPLRDFLEVRGLGVLDVRAMFGDAAIRQNKSLRLIVHLQRMSDEDIRSMDRMPSQLQQHTILDVAVDRITLPVAPGRHLAVLVEGAVRNHLLRLGGYDAAQRFMDQQRALIEADIATRPQ